MILNKIRIAVFYGIVAKEVESGPDFYQTHQSRIYKQQKTANNYLLSATAATKFKINSQCVPVFKVPILEKLEENIRGLKEKIKENFSKPKENSI